jgi:hypothetical protein
MERAKSAMKRSAIRPGQREGRIVQLHNTLRRFHRCKVDFSTVLCRILRLSDESLASL